LSYTKIVLSEFELLEENSIGKYRILAGEQTVIRFKKIVTVDCLYLYFVMHAKIFVTIKFASGVNSRKTRILLVTKNSQFRVIQDKGQQPHIF
jgi:hypothetical protein